MATQDYYEILQVHPKADAAAIVAAYQRLVDQYAPERLDGAAPELVELARQKRSAIEQAYVVLGDQVRRAAYDADQRTPTTNDRPKATDHEPTANGQRPEPPKNVVENATGQSSVVDGQSSVVDGRPAEPPLDYRPLPPASRQERQRGFDDQPTQVRGVPAGARMPAGFAALVVAAVVLLPALLAGFALTGGGSTPPPVATPTPAPEDQFEALITQARSFTEQNPNDAQGWIDYGNLLYDSAQIVREQAPDSLLYQQRLPRWLDAAGAYERAFELDPANTAVLADKGASACFYGAGAGDETFLAQGLADTSTALDKTPQEPRVLLSHGYCLVYARPPRTAEAIDGWRKILELVPSDSQLAGQAQMLIDQYSQQ